MGTTLLFIGTLIKMAVSDISPETLEALVKIAGVGTAGICVLGLFVAGIITSMLPNDVSEAKLAAVRMFKNLCITTALICLASTVLTSYFNNKKVVKAEEQATNTRNEYVQKVDGLMQSKNMLEADVNRLKEMIAQQPAVSMEAKQMLLNIDATVKSMDLQVSPKVLEQAQERELNKNKRP
jgi:hypothetical protein